MKTLLLLSVLLVSANVPTTAPVLVREQSGNLLISGPVLNVDEKYTDCWLEYNHEEIAEAERTSDTTWTTPVPDYPSFQVCVSVCSSNGSCRVLEVTCTAKTPTVSLAYGISFAALAGLLMNFMPCVLPVIGLKLAAFSQPGKRLGYVAGVLASFMLLATCSVGLGTGLSLMGFEHYRLTLSVVCFLFGISLLHVWEMPSFGFSGNIGPFGVGVLTVALGSSCAVPFLAPAMAYTMQCSSIEVYIIFLALGVGFCSPFFLPLSRLMTFFRHYLSSVEAVCGMGLFLTSLWLCSTLDFKGMMMFYMTSVLLSGVLVAFTKYRSDYPRKLWTLVITLMVMIMFLPLIRHAIRTGEDTNTGINGQVIPELDVPQVTFVTADWCINCEPMKLVMQSDSIQSKVSELGIITTTLDYSDRPPLVREFLDACYVRDVPTVRIVSIDGVVTVLSGVWTVQDVLDALDATVVSNVQAEARDRAQL